MPRAHRFAIATKVRYRETGTRTWREATSVNISRSGVLLVPGATLHVGARIELILTLSESKTDPPPADVRCTGRIVRVTSDPTRMAVAVESHGFIRSITAIPMQAR